MNSSGRLNARNPAVHATVAIKSSSAEFCNIRSARCLSPAPSCIAASGAPPMPISCANADTSVIIGNATPSPVSASDPAPAMRPMYIRSTML